MSKQKVQLQAGAQDSVSVEDVDVNRGVCFKNKQKDDPDIRFLTGNSEVGYKIVCAESVEQKTLVHKSICKAMEYMSNWDCFTLSGLRIVTEKELTVGDLQDTDHVGFVHGNGKGYITYSKSRFIMANTEDYSTQEHGNFGSGGRTIPEAFKDAKTCYNHPTEIYKFTTRRELYAWLAE